MKKRDVDHKLYFYKNMSNVTDLRFWEQFIKLYRSLPCLWATKTKDYSDKNLKKQAYDRLIEKCRERYPEADKEYVCKKIHNLRCGFRRELKKVNEMRNSSTDYVPNLWYYDLISFILENESEPSEFNGRELESGSIFDRFQKSVETTFDVDLEPPAKKFKIKKGLKGRTKDLINSAEKTLLEVNTIIKEDEWDVAGKKLAFDLRKMDERQRTIAEKIIGDVVFFGKLNLLGEDYSITPGTPYRQC